MAKEEIFVPRKPFILSFGRYKGKSLEEIPFLSGYTTEKGGPYYSGYDYLDYLIENFSDSELVKHTKAVKEACKAKRPIVHCQCGKHLAFYAWVSADSSGSTISFSQSERYGKNERECKHITDVVDGKLIPFAFSSIKSFRNPKERKKFIELLKFCLFGWWDAEITAENAFDYLFKGIVPARIQLSLF